MTSHRLSKLKYGLAISLALSAPSLAHADQIILDTWTGASIGSYDITGYFQYDVNTNSIVSDTTAITPISGTSPLYWPGCAAGACGLTAAAPNAFGQEVTIGAVAALIPTTPSPLSGVPYVFLLH